MSSRILTLFISCFLLLLIFAGILPSCVDNQLAPEDKADDSTVDSTSPDYILDTVSAVSLLADSIDDEAYQLSEKLKQVLPVITFKDRKFYITEGDLLLDGTDLYYYAQNRLQRKIRLDAAISKDTSYVSDHIESGALTVATTRGGPAIWPKDKIIQFAVLRKSFDNPDDYQHVVKMVQKAVSDWMGVCNIRFQYMSVYDDLDPDIYPEEPLDFVVREYNSHNKFLAMAFFPGEPKYKRRLLIDPSLYTTNVSKEGVLRHELGHILGFRHEHIWSEEHDCQGESVVQGFFGGQQVTAYDPYSVMHYLCGNSGTATLELTLFDKEGARKVYP